MTTCMKCPLIRVQLAFYSMLDVCNAECAQKIPSDGRSWNCDPEEDEDE